MKVLEKERGVVDKDSVQVIQELSNGYIRIYEITEAVEDPDSGLITIKISDNIDLIKGGE